MPVTVVSIFERRLIQMEYGSSTVTRMGAGGRMVQNEAKSGAYYTSSQIKVLSDMFDFSEEPTTCFDPTCGDGQMLVNVTGKKVGDNKALFGVEIRQSAAQATKERPEFEEVLLADFTNGVKIKNKHMTFIAGNPPYMEEVESSMERKRLEEICLDKVTNNYLKRGGILVWIIPINAFLKLTTQRVFASHYEILSVWRFEEEEFLKWHQVIIVAKKIDRCFPEPEKVKEQLEKYTNDDGELIRELPATFEGTEFYHSVKVPPSDPEGLIPFCTQQFDAEGAYAFLINSPEVYKEHLRSVDSITTQVPFQAGSVGKPPIPLKKDSLYLLATSGAVGDGVVGVEGEDLHLMRGVAEVVEDVRDVTEEGKGEDPVIEVTSHTSITVSVIETSGLITYLQ